MSIDLASILNFTNSTSSTSNVTSYPQNNLHRSTYYRTLFDTTLLPYNKQYNNCIGTFCYTHSKGTFIYKPHTDIGMVGRTAAGYLGQRKRM
jgi:hypothetical protein